MCLLFCKISASSDESDVNQSAGNYDSSDTTIDSDNTIIDEDDHQNDQEHMTIYPDISAIASTFE